MPAKSPSAEHSIESKVRTVVSGLCHGLERGNSAELHAWLEMMAKFHQYSFWNVVMIRLQRPDASRVAGREMWKLHGRSIVPGANGIEINVPILPQWAYRLPPRKKKPMRCSGFRPGNVFDISDTVGRSPCGVSEHAN